VTAGFLQKISDLAARRNYDDMTLGPILTVTNERLKNIDDDSVFLHLEGITMI